MKQLLINREWSQNNNYWLEVRAATTDQQGMKLEQHLLIQQINGEWSYYNNNGEY